jgi:hypothetical protein
MPGQAEFSGASLDRRDDLVGDELMDVEALFLADRSVLRVQEGEEGRLQIMPGGGALARRPRIVLQLEQGRLDGLRRRLQLLAAPLNDLAPQDALAVDFDECGIGHGLSSLGLGFQRR